MHVALVARAFGNVWPHAQSNLKWNCGPKRFLRTCLDAGSFLKYILLHVPTYVFIVRALGNVLPRVIQIEMELASQEVSSCLFRRQFLFWYTSISLSECVCASRALVGISRPACDPNQMELASQGRFLRSCLDLSSFLDCFPGPARRPICIVCALGSLVPLVIQN